MHTGYSHYQDENNDEPEKAFMCLDTSANYTQPSTEDGQMWQMFQKGPHDLCMDAGGDELVELGYVYNATLGYHVAERLGCWIRDASINSKASCEAATGSPSTTEFYTCGMFADPAAA